MNFPAFIAKRYLLAKKSHNAINIISIFSVAGITVGTIALIVILSVFNGFNDLVHSMFNTFYSDVEIRASEGKVFVHDSIMPIINNIPEIESVAEIVEDNALLKYDDKQAIAVVRGVNESYLDVTRLDTMIYEGEYLLKDTLFNYALIGRGIKYHLAVGLEFASSIVLYVPDRKKKIVSPNRTDLFKRQVVRPSGFFSTQPEIDEKYIIVPIEIARNLFQYTNEVSALQLKLSKPERSKSIISKLQNELGSNYKVHGRIQQNELLYKTMKSEKWAIFFILTFILLVSSLNTIGTLTILIIEKKKDIKILNQLGASLSTIKKTFIIEGWFISIAGAMAGLLLGSLVCLIQQEFGLVKLQGTGTFIIDAYPIIIKLKDILLVFVTVIVIGVLTTLYPTYLLPKKFIKPE